MRTQSGHLISVSLRIGDIVFCDSSYNPGFTSNGDYRRNKVIVVKVISQWNRVNQLGCMVS